MSAPRSRITGDTPVPPTYAPARDTNQVARQIIIHATTDAAFDTLGDPSILGIHVGSVYSHRKSLLLVWEAAEVQSLSSLYEMLSRLHNRGLVAFAERNRILRAAAVPNDLLYADQWALRTIGAEAAWARVAKLPVSPVVVAIVDSGVDRDHTDLKDHYSAGTPSSPTDPGVDEFEHGSLLAGTIGAVTGNHEGIAGTFGPPPTTPIRLISAKFFEAHHLLTSYNASVAVWEAVDLGADVINASWDVGMPVDNLGIGGMTDSLRLAIKHAAAMNVVFVAAAGNDGTDNDVLPTWPARYDDVIAVMATDEGDSRPSFSNYGALTVHLAAPGVDILSTHSYRWNAQGTFHPTKYRPYTGTSPAAAHVSGAAALLRALKPGWAPSIVRAHLVASADPVPWVTCVAHGRLNLQRAVCGPITVTGPSSGDTWARNALVKIHWHLDYQTPAVKTVSIWLHGGVPAIPATLLAAAVPNTGSCSAWAPNVKVNHVHLRIVSDQASFIYAESAGFFIA